MERIALMIEYGIDGTQRLITARMTGCISLIDLMAHIIAISRDHDCDPAFNLLFAVADDVTFAILPAEREFETLIKEWIEHRKGIKWAFWAPVGVAHSHVQYALEILHLKHSYVGLFQNEHTALNWLVEPRD